ncbi:MAG: DUF2520 domain-containing protein [Lachnospiraceae bacterium]|nr:DUF2520 domain-containing protein [Lachnospiraceae bacterium]
MVIGFIGAGRTGCTLGKYLNGYATVAGYYSRTWQSADDAATFTQSRAFCDLETLVNNCDTIFITTPDGVISEVWECLKHYNIKDKIVCHFSGSLSSGIFSNAGSTGASCCSVHPMYAFSSKYKSYLQFNTACLSVEGQERAVQEMKKLFEMLHHKVFIINPCDKAKYHAAAVFASNYVTGVLHIALHLLKECGFNESDAMELLAPVTLNNINSVLENGTVRALTGPVERGDISTVKRHFSILKNEDINNIYKNLGKVLVSISEEKNPQKDYKEIKDMFV